MTQYRIPFNKLGTAGKELDYISEAIDNGYLSGGGSFAKKCERELESTLGVPRAMLTPSCTHALEMAALLLDIRPGDEVIVPSFTFVTTINAFVLRGARPVFADIRPDTLNIDETSLDRLVTPRTRALLVTHYAGVGCEMSDLVSFARRHDIPIVEDNAHGLFGRYRGNSLGTFGVLATLSFHETKNFSCGEGGALLINDPSYIDRAEILQEKGTDRSRFFRGQTDKYTWVDLGSSYLPSELQAAFLLAQLEARESIQARRRAIWERYAEGLTEWAGEAGARLPVVPADREQSYHLFYVLLPSHAQRQRMIEELKARGIESVFHYVPLHLSPMGLGFGGKPGDCPVTEDLSDRLLRLPFYNDLELEDQRCVVDAVRESVSQWTL